jgi:predicted membrane-bound spermidine synthase
MAETPARPGRFYAGLFVLTFATLVLELVETRLLSVMMWYHLAFFVISASMFGMTAGAVWAYLNRARHTQETLSHDLAWLSAAFALSTAGSLALQLTLAPGIVASATLAVVLAELALAIALPFFWSGAAVSLALTKSPFPTGRVYAVDLAGAALGCLGVLAVLQWTDAPSAILLTGAAAAGASALFAGSRIGTAPADTRTWRVLRRPGVIAVVLLALGVANGLTRHGLQPIMVKESVERRRGEVIFERWNSFSRVIAMRPVVGQPKLWGPSPTLPKLDVPQVWLTIDGDAGTTMFRYHGEPESVRFLSYDVANLVYALSAGSRTAVVGVGGGRDLLSAWTFGSRDVTGVEFNPIFVHLLQDPGMLSDFAGIARLPGVRIVHDEARSWFSRTGESFDVIQMCMADTWAATGAGAFTLTENGLYTVAGWRAFVSRLSERGLFSVSRWYQPGDVDETGRLLSLAVATLFETGAPLPRAHVFMAAAGPVATLILSRAPLGPADIATLRRFCGVFEYQVLVSPDATPASPVLAEIVGAVDRAALDRLTAEPVLDLSPPTDDRPFFFNLLPLDRPHLALRYLGRVGVVRGNLMATLTLTVILLVSLALVVVTIVLPLRSALREAGRAVVTGGTLYFALLGLGFMLVEIGLLQRLSLFLGHPVYSLAVVLFGLILFAGAGSWLSESLRLDGRGRLALWAVAVALYIGSLPWWMPAFLAPHQSAEIALRAAVSLAVIAPAGLLMGFGFPTGMRLASARDARPTVWFWGINGAAGVLGSVLAVALSIGFGIGATLIAGAVCYLALAPAAAVIAAAPRR